MSISILNELSQAAYLLLLLIFVPIPFATDRKLSSQPWVTYALIAVNTIVFVMVIFPIAGTQRQIDLFAVWGVIPRLPGFLPLITSLFLHVSPAHLVWNMAFLWVFGPSCEEALGHIAYIVFYVAGGIVAGLLHTAIVLLFAEHSAVAFAPLVGASGAISALVGMYAIRFYRSKLRLIWICASFLKLKTARFEAPAIAGVALWFLQNLFGAINALFQPDRNGIAYWAHIGGFIFGMAVAEITGLMGEGMREYLFADAVNSKERGVEGTRLAVEKFKLLLQRRPDDQVVRDALSSIANQANAPESSHVQEAVGEAYAALIQQAIASGDDAGFNEWAAKFDQINAASALGISALYVLAEQAVKGGKLLFAERIYTSVTSRFPESGEAKHAELALAAIWLEGVTSASTTNDLLLPHVRAALHLAE